METELSNRQTNPQPKNSHSHVWKFFIYSMIGVFYVFYSDLIEWAIFHYDRSYCQWVATITR